MVEKSRSKSTTGHVIPGPDHDIGHVMPGLSFAVRTGRKNTNGSFMEGTDHTRLTTVIAWLGNNIDSMIT